MLFVKLTNGQPDQFPYSVGHIRRDNPQTSFPKQIPNSILQSYDVYEVIELDKPDYDPLVQTLVRGTPVYNNDKWEVSYTTASKSDADAKASVRNQRDRLLIETDWMALSDVTMSDTMTAYRQALRDIPSQAGFPFSVTWPTKPEA